jgi:DNA-3-methyladenine glycosylase I
VSEQQCPEEKALAPFSGRILTVPPAIHFIAQSSADADWNLGSFMVKKRCGWVGESNPLMLEYHDREWGVPVHDDGKHFEFLVLEGAQAGLSWSIVLNKREGYRRAFSEFDPNKVARYTEKRVQKLLLDPGIIRNRQKIEAAVRNARAFLAIQEEFGSFDAYSWPFVGGQPKVNRWKVMKQIPSTSTESDAFSKDLKQRGFSFVGSTVIYAHMQAVGMVNDHLVDCFRYREVATA